MSRFPPHRVTVPIEDADPTASSNPTQRSVALHVVDSDDSARMPSFEELYRTHARYVATIALRLLGRPDDVDDIVHDTFLQVRRSLPRLRDPKAVRGWLGTITVRVARRWLRRARLRRFVGLGEVAADDVSGSTLEADDYEFVHSAYATLGRLGTEERIAWVLRRVHGAQLEMVATMAGCSLATAKRRIAAADKALGSVNK